MIRVYVIPPHSRSSNYRLRWRQGRKWREKSSRTSDAKEAQRAAQRLESELNQGRAVTGERLSWQAFCDRYEDEHLRGLSDRSFSAWNTASNHVDRLMGWQWLDEANAESLSAFFGKLRNGGLGEASIATYARTLRAALNWATHRNLLPPVRVQPPKGGGSMRSRPVTLQEFKAMLRAVPRVRPSDHRLWRRLLRGLWLSGLRLGEVLVFGWESHYPIAVALGGRHPQFRIWAKGEKGRKDRRLPMTPDFAKWLLRTKDRTGLVFPLPYRTVDNIGKVITAIGREAGIEVGGKHASAHDLRRSFGTRWASRVMPPKLRALMRHENIQTTMKYYVAIDADEFADDLWDRFG